MSKKAEIFNNFARVKHAVFETIKPRSRRSGAGSAVANSEADVGSDHGPGCGGGGVIQISRKAWTRNLPRTSREDLHDLELVARTVATGSGAARELKQR